MNTTSAGNFAENAVAEELIRQGYKIIEQNWKTKFAEIDVIARKDNTLFFTEVKYRKTPAAGDGFDYITAQKLRRMQRAADAYVNFSGWTGPYVLLAASVLGDLEAPGIEIIEV